MKVFSISKWAFSGICLLILALPVSRHWRLITGGNRTSGRVTAFITRTREAGDGTIYVEHVSEIQYQAGDRILTTYGPDGIEYRAGRNLVIFYSPENPGKNCIFTFSSLYLTDYSVLPLILLVVWAAFYLSFNDYSKKPRSLSR